MGAFFEKTFVRAKNSPIFPSWIGKAAEEIGYTMGAEGKGVPVNIRVFDRNTEWFMLESPLLDARETAERFAAALSKGFKAPVLKLSCVDSDFAICRIIDALTGSDTAACINEPYGGFDIGPFEPEKWTAACKKKWKCTEKKFEELFSGRYLLAEDGIRSLAELIQLPEVALCADGLDESRVFTRSFWITPKKEFDAAPFPRTLAERLAAFIDERYAAALTDMGFRRFGGSSLRWHKVFGKEGNEIVSSIVFTVRYDCEIDMFYGSQAVCCPLVLSDKFHPMHDWHSYWLEAYFAFSWFNGYDPMRKRINGIDHVGSSSYPEFIVPYMDELMLKQLGDITDIASLCAFDRLTNEHSINNALTRSMAYRLLVESILAGDHAEAHKWAEKLDENDIPGYEYFPANPAITEMQMLPELPRVYLEQGAEACISELKKVRDANMKRLKKGGVV